MSKFITLDSYAIFDGEFPNRDVTKGLDPLSFGAVCMGRVSPEHWFYGEAKLADDVQVEEPNASDPGSLAVAGFTVEEAYNPMKPSARHLVQALLNWRASLPFGGILTAQNSLDFAYLESAARRGSIKLPKNTYRTLDLHTMAVLFAEDHQAELANDPAFQEIGTLTEQGTSNLGLPIIARMVGINLDDYRGMGHNGLVDAVITTEIVHRLRRNRQPLFQDLTQMVLLANIKVEQYRAGYRISQ